MSVLDAVAFLLFCRLPAAWTHNCAAYRLLPAASRWAYRNEPPIAGSADEGEEGPS